MLATSLSSCEFNCSAGSDKAVKTKTVTSEENTTLSGATIKNDVDIEATGVKIAEVYLMDDDRNYLPENVAKLNEKIHLVIKADTGWVKEKGLSFLGASERISTSTGKVIVDAADIFKEYEATGLPADKANIISLSARITEADPGLEDFVVQFRVWDKKGKGEVKGKYKFKIRQ
jgi:hypothetical protein